MIVDGDRSNLKECPQRATKELWQRLWKKRLSDASVQGVCGKLNGRFHGVGVRSRTTGPRGGSRDCGVRAVWSADTRRLGATLPKRLSSRDKKEECIESTKIWEKRGLKSNTRLNGT